MSESRNIIWTYPLNRITSDKSGRRTTLLDDPGTAWDLVGFDASVSGGLRPSNGFLKVADLRTVLGSEFASGDDIRGNDVRAWTVRVSDDFDLSGFVVRLRKSGGSYNVYVVWNDNGTWSAPQTLVSGSLYDNMSVEVLGRFVYVYVRGQTPYRFYFKGTSGSVTYAGEAVSSPTVKAFDQETYDNATNLSSTPFDDGVSPNTEDRVFFGEFVNTAPGFDSGGTVTNPPQNVWDNDRVFLAWEPRFSGTGPDTPDLTLGAGESYYSYSNNLTNKQIQLLQRGLRKFSTNAWAAEKWDVPQVPGDTSVSVSYVLYNSETGVQSVPSNVVKVFAYTRTRSGQPPATNAYSGIAFEGIVNTSKWDSIRVYRSVWGVPNSLVGGSMFLALDEKITDVTAATQGTTTGWTRISGIVSLSDTGIQQTNDVVKTLDVVSPPKGGAAVAYEGSMFVSDVPRDTTTETTTGEVYYTVTERIAGDQFPALNVFDLAVPFDQIVAWEVVSDNLVGATATQQYLLRKDGPYVKMVGMHKGYGTVGPYATTSYGGAAYIVTPTGLVAVSNRGRLEPTLILDHLILEPWRNSTGGVIVESDPQIGVIFVLNPTLEHMALMWMRTGTLTELVDAKFVGITRGFVPGSESRGTRAMFVSSNGLVHIYDSGGEKTTGSSQRITMMDVSGDALLRYSSVDTTNPNAPVVTVLNSVGLTPTLDESVAGQVYLYINNGTGYGKKYLVTAIDNTAKTLTLSDPNADFASSVAASNPLALSPVYCRWVGSSLGMSDPQGNRFASPASHQAKHIDYLGVFFTDVSGPLSASSLAKYRALAYSGNSETPKNSVLVKDPSGTEINSITEGEVKYIAYLPTDAVYLFPGWEAIVVDYTFNAVSVRVEGRIRSTKKAGARA